MYIKRDRYLNKLTDRMGNGQIKIITGVSRCGKSFLLFNIFCEYLKAQGISDDQIIAIALDNDMNEKYKDPKELSLFVRSRIIDESKTYYISLCSIK